MGSGWGMGYLKTSLYHNTERAWCKEQERGGAKGEAREGVKSKPALLTEARFQGKLFLLF